MFLSTYVMCANFEDGPMNYECNFICIYRLVTMMVDKGVFS